MRADGFENVRLEPVRVPQVGARQREPDVVVSPFPRPLSMLGLGGSVGTPPGGIEAEALVVARASPNSRARAADAQGPHRRVQRAVHELRRDGAVPRRRRVAGGAARRRGRRWCARSGPWASERPTRAPQLSRRISRGSRPLPSRRGGRRGAGPHRRRAASASCCASRWRPAFEADTESANVVAEIRGRERPDEVVVIGGHFDSWDVGTGATDDGVGCIVAWEAARLMKAIGLQARGARCASCCSPTRRTACAAGSPTATATARPGRHVLMIEADSGVFPPIGLGVSGSDVARGRLRDIATLLAGIGVGPRGSVGRGRRHRAERAGRRHPGGVDQWRPGPLLPHPSHAGRHRRPDRPQDVSRAVAAMAVLAYLAAEMPERFGELR